VLAKKRKRSQDERAKPLILLTELNACFVADGVIIIEGKAGDIVRKCAVTPGYARALSGALTRCLAEMAASGVAHLRRARH
jgi:hypothetical protein